MEWNGRGGGGLGHILECTQTCHIIKCFMNHYTMKYTFLFSRRSSIYHVRFNQGKVEYFESMGSLESAESKSPENGIISKRNPIFFVLAGFCSSYKEMHVFSNESKSRIFYGNSQWQRENWGRNCLTQFFHSLLFKNSVFVFENWYSRKRILRKK